MEELRLEMREAKDSCISSWMDEVARKIDAFHSK